MDFVFQSDSSDLTSTSIGSYLITTGLVALLLVLYLLDRHLSSTGRRLSRALCTLWSGQIVEDGELKSRKDRPTAAGVRNALGQLVSSIYSLPGKCSFFVLLSL